MRTYNEVFLRQYGIALRNGKNNIFVKGLREFRAVVD